MKNRVQNIISLTSLPKLPKEIGNFQLSTQGNKLPPKKKKTISGMCWNILPSKLIRIKFLIHQERSKQLQGNKVSFPNIKINCSKC